MTRIDLTTRELHGLLQPVLPHASTDATLPSLGCVHVELSGGIAYAVASDRYTLAATRHYLDEPADDVTLLIDRADVAALLKLFTFTKDEDPKLTLIFDKMPIAVHDTTLDGFGLRIDAEDGTRLILHDRSPAGEKRPLANWKTMVGRAVHRDQVGASPSLLLTPSLMPRWAKAASKGERLIAFFGSESTDPILIAVEKHFIGIWMPCAQLDSDMGENLLDGNPWRDELPKPSAA